MSETIATLEKTVPALLTSGWLEPFDAAFSDAVLRRLADFGEALREERAALGILAALAMREAQRGHVCVDLSCPGRWLPNDPTVRLPAAYNESGGWITSLQRLDKHWAKIPLVFERNRLYLQRFQQDEAEIAASVASRLAAGSHRTKTPDLGKLLDAFDDAQQQAIRWGVSANLSIVTGGPGTGKTSTVVGIVAAALEANLNAGDRPLKIELLTPTGKAASRLREALVSTGERLGLGNQVGQAVTQSVGTLHRRLWQLEQHAQDRGGFGQPRGAGTEEAGGHAPDLVIVDEVSMVDVPTAARLLRVLPIQSRLVLVGDANQLASVEAGSMFHDLCSVAAEVATEHHPERRASQLSLSFAAAPQGGEQEDFEGTAQALGRATTVLRRGHRFSTLGAIDTLADVVLRGDPDELLRHLRATRSVEVRWVNDPGHQLPQEVLRAARTQAHALESEPNAAGRLALLSDFRILCAHRRGPRSVERVHEELLLLRPQRQGSPGTEELPLFDGLPILVTENDAQLGLSNGDHGITMQTPEGLRIVFPSEQGQLRSFAPAQLPHHQPLYALSIHKSQGSEMNRVFVLLPAQPSPVLTRELLYTAVTRAKEQVTVFGSAEVLQAAVKARVHRMSGLADRLRSPRAPAPSTRLSG